MPVNIPQLFQQIQQTGSAVSSRNQTKKKQIEKVYSLYKEIAELPDLDQKLAEILAGSRQQRCAKPGNEGLFHFFSAVPEKAESTWVLASDGSQIIPDRHEEITFGLINAAVFILKTHSQEVPQIKTETSLLDMANEDMQEEFISEEQISLQRDVIERKMLTKAALTLQKNSPVIALTDGPLELFSRKEVLNSQKKLVEEYHRSLQKLADAGITAAGYIDRPRANLVIRMIELLSAQDDSENSLENAETSQFPLVCDSDLFLLLLKAGQRSPVFKLHSPSNNEMPEDVRSCFFYLNTGTIHHPYLSRIEILQKTAADPEKVNDLQWNILEQNRILGTHPYPYVLHRAHECAVITMEEKEHVKNLLIQDMLSRGEMVSEKSNKQFAKDAGEKIFH